MRKYEPLELERNEGKGEDREAKESLSDGFAPADVKNLCYLSFFALGTGVLFPWNAFITATDYFEYIHEGKHPAKAFSVAYMLPNVCILGLLLLNPLPSFTPAVRVYTGFALYLVCLSSVWVSQDFVLHVSAVALAGLADGIAQGSVFGAVSSLPPRFTQAVVSGTSVSGLVISLLRCLTKVSVGTGGSQSVEEMTWSTYLYFSVAMAFCLFCIFVQFYLPRLPFYRYYLYSTSSEHQDGGCNGTDLEYEHVKLTGTGEGGEAKKEHEGFGEISSLGMIFKQTWHMAMGLFLVYAVTLSIFPGFLAEDVESAAMGDWYPILLITLFNLFDFMGKSSPIFERFQVENPNLLFGLTCLRFCFYGLYIFATSGPAMVKGDPFGPTYVSTITAALGFSNGWVTANCLMTAPSRVKARDAEKTEMFMVWFLLLGLLVGALLGWLWLL